MAHRRVELREMAVVDSLVVGTVVLCGLGGVGSLDDTSSTSLISIDTDASLQPLRRDLLIEWGWSPRCLSQQSKPTLRQLSRLSSLSGTRPRFMVILTLMHVSRAWLWQLRSLLHFNMEVIGSYQLQI